MIAVDHAPAIAAFLAERAEMPGAPGESYAASVRAAWPRATGEEIERGALIALELLDLRLAELRAEALPPRPEPGPERRAEIAAGVATILSEMVDIEDLPAAMRRIGRLYPDLTWSTFQEAVSQAGNLWPAGEGDAP
ncbi:hypothetical protein SAMN02799636_01112 [Methylobacterium sp. 275MFSha3.1]|uniref:hypothetical protein n=1 Tax=Methylobacterium sp. 275MFSha3.1 TaxID=1502746 RepID=UPI0008A744D1|nr:hypothetical protein [Methylobacterium sp. 275MFSha3.1]SEH31654.1 hypothetical protein SAMN02799636_01112 [Methylobacterium sp. 275MFSha3.1]